MVQPNWTLHTPCLLAALAGGHPTCVFMPEGGAAATTTTTPLHLFFWPPAFNAKDNITTPQHNVEPGLIPAYHLSCDFRHVTHQKYEVRVLSVPQWLPIGLTQHAAVKLVLNLQKVPARHLHLQKKVSLWYATFIIPLRLSLSCEMLDVCFLKVSWLYRLHREKRRPSYRNTACVVLKGMLKLTHQTPDFMYYLVDAGFGLWITACSLSLASWL